MQVPCPVPLESPWSPVGYHVVEVAVEQEPARVLAAKTNDRPPAPFPRSPLGYRVILVAEEKPVLAPARTQKRPARRLSPRKRDPVILGVPIAAGVCLIVLVIGFLTVVAAAANATRREVVHLPVRAPIMPEVPQVPEAPQVVLPEPAQMANLPEKRAPEDRDLFAQAAEPAERPDNALAAAAGPPECETFGTTVRFVRNPAEATRLARAENKLTFLLHVSRNFEESRFT